MNIAISILLRFNENFGQAKIKKRTIARIYGAFVFTCKREVKSSREWPRVQKREEKQNR